MSATAGGAFRSKRLDGAKCLPQHLVSAFHVMFAPRMVAPPTTPRSFAVDVARASAAFQEIARQMGAQFLDKQEIIRLMTVSAIAGEHMVIVGPPGTAKSAMIDMFSKLIDARYFEYLLTRFTEPNELFGPVDISAFREGRYTRRLEHTLPTAESVFLAEIF